MLAYRIWTWVAICLLAFGSIAVFVTFLVQALRPPSAGQKPPAPPADGMPGQAP